MIFPPNQLRENRYLPRIIHIVAGLLLGITALTFAHAQSPGDSQQPQSGESLADVGAQLANPVSSVWSIVFQNNFTFLEGPLFDSAQ